MTADRQLVILIDDLRSFVDNRDAEVARSSSGGVRLLTRHQNSRIDELWLDHDLGEDDTIWPVIEVLERAAFEGHPFDVGIIKIHSANPAGAARLVQVLRHWGYPVQMATGVANVGYVDKER